MRAEMADITLQAAVVADRATACVPGGVSEHTNCLERGENLQRLAEQLRQTLDRAERAPVPDADPTIRTWIDALLQERRHDLEAISALGRIAASNYNRVAWTAARVQLDNNPHRGATARAFESMLPNHQDFTQRTD